MSRWFGGGARPWLALALAVCMLLLAGGLPRPALADTPALPLTAAERTWIAEHPLLRVGLAQDFPPYLLRDEASGQVHGFVVETMTLWSQRTGLRFEFRRFDRHEQMLAALQHGEIDLTPFTVPLQSHRPYAVSTRPAYLANLVLAARRDVPDISPTGDFGGRRVAVEQGSGTEALLGERYPQARLQRYDSTEAALRAVAGGQADLFIGTQQAAVYQIERLLLANIELRRNLGPGAVPFGPLVRADEPLLRSILDKAVASIDVGDRSRLAERWLPAASVRVPLPAASAQLSDAELRWVHAKGGLRVGYDASFSPVTVRGPLGEFQGYGADVFRLVAEKAGLGIDQEVGASFAEVYDKGRRGEIDVIVGMARTAQRRADYDFVGPFMTMPTVLVSRSDEARPVAETRDIGHRKLALLRSHFLIPELRARHPGITLVEVERQDQVLSAVAEGAADVGLGNLSVVHELIEQRFVGRVSITGIVKDGDSELYFAVPRQFPELTRVLARSVEAINDSETATLRARWLAREVPGGLSWALVLKVALPLLALLLSYLVLLWIGNRRLRRARAAEQQARQAAEEQTAARGRFLAYLSHELRGTLGAVSSGAEMLKNNPDPALRERLLDAIGHSSSMLLNMLEATLRHEQSLHTPLQPEPETVALGAWWAETLGPARLAAERKGLRFSARWLGSDDGAPPVPQARFDALRLQQVLQNLLNNAVKFTRSGEVAVQAALLPPQPGASAQLRVEVRDSGPGLSDDDRLQLFKPYAQGEQGRRAHQGAGLGLAISAQIVAALGGRLEAPPQPAGAGACFAVQLPVTALDAAAPASDTDGAGV